MDALTNGEGNATGIFSSEEKDAGLDEKNPKPSLVPSSEQRSSDPDQEVEEEGEAAPDAYLPPGWTCIKLEPDW